MTALDLVMSGAILALGSALQGALGFGLALVSVPFLVMIDPRLVPGPIICAAFVLTLLMVLRDRHAIDRFGMKWGLVGRLPGTVAGALVLQAIPVEQLGLALSGLVLVAVLMSLGGLHLRPNAPTLVVAGALSGFMGTISSIGGPPIALVYQHEVGARLRGTLAGYFLIGCVLSLIALVFVGRFGRAELLWSLALTPGVVLGYALSGRLVPIVDRGYTRGAVLGLSTAAALAVIASYVL